MAMHIKNNAKKNVWSRLFHLVLPHKKKFILIVLIGMLSTGANLIEPLIYREAINDVAGLFVRQANENRGIRLNESQREDSSTHGAKVVSPSKNVKEAHRKGHVAERSPGQALKTLVWAVAFIFLVNVTGYVLTLVGENMNVKLSCLVEQRFIQNTF